MTTGLVALVDDCIKRKYHNKKTVQLVLPTAGKQALKMNMEYIGPKRLIEEIFNRRPAVSRSHTAPQRSTPLTPQPPSRAFTC